MSSGDLAPYPVLLDGAAHVIGPPAYYQTRGLIVANNGSVSLTVTSGRGESWTVGPGGRLEAPQPVASPSYTFQSERADPAGALASVTFTLALLPVLSNSNVATTSAHLVDLLLLPQTVVPAWGGPPAVPYTVTLDRPPGVDAISVVSNGGCAGFNFSGNGTGILYASWTNSDTGISGGIKRISANISALDTSVTVQGWSPTGGGGSIWVVGHRYTVPGTYAASGALLVAMDATENPIPVQFRTAQAVTVSGIPAAEAVQSAHNVVTAPGAGVTIASLTVTTSATYRVEIDLAVDDSAGIGKILQCSIAGTFGWYQPAPGARTVILPAFALTGGQTVMVAAGPVAGAAGSHYTADIRLYAV